jgi:uncharacterized protein (DUF1697 family)
MTQFVALLRGINLGKRRIKMADLRKDFGVWGFSDVQTVLASGNVIFESEERDPAKVQSMIEAGFKDTYDWEVPTCVRRAEEIVELVESDPFANIKMHEKIQRYVTFLNTPADSDLEIPYSSLDGDYRILDLQPGYLVSVLDRSQGRGTLDAMELLGKEFGEGITTRNWNTVLKIHAKLANG